MLREDKKLKRFLVLQSFGPLFLLIFIQHVGHGNLVIRFFCALMQGDWSVIGQAWKSSFLGDVIITELCVVWFQINQRRTGWQR